MEKLFLDEIEKLLPFKNSVITKSASSHILCNKMCKQLYILYNITN